MKRSELQALYANENPDAKKVAELTGELYDLETELRKKAEAAELDTPYAYRHGPDMMQGYGGGHGWHMMGWYIVFKGPSFTWLQLKKRLSLVGKALLILYM
jgi:hypothetical protein